MDGDPDWNPLVPELTVAELERSLRFHRAAGFVVRFRRTVPLFADLEHGQAQGDEPFRGLKDAWYPVSTTAQEGQRGFLAEDADGHLMRFAQPSGTRHAG